jgi:hypothetical protein
MGVVAKKLDAPYKSGHQRRVAENQKSEAETRWSGLLH